MKFRNYVLYCVGMMVAVMYAGGKQGTGYQRLHKKKPEKIVTVWDRLGKKAGINSSDLQPPSGRPDSQGSLHPEELEGLLESTQQALDNGYQALSSVCARGDLVQAAKAFSPTSQKLRARSQSTSPQHVEDGLKFTVEDAFAFQLPIKSYVITDGKTVGPLFHYEGVAQDITNQQVTQFLQAVDQNDTGLLEHLLKEHPSLAIARYGEFGIPALLYATWHNKKKAARCLIEGKADPAAAGKFVTTTPLECAKAKNHKMIKQLLERALNKDS